MGKDTNRKFEYNCVMADLKIPYWNSLVNRIEENDLYTEEDDESFGREFDPHVTILFGLHDTIPDSYIKRVVNRIRPIPLRIKSISVFANDDYDVLKFDVRSKYLNHLNKTFKKFPYTSSYSSYNPHITTAYLKPGRGEKYFRLYDDLPTKKFVSEEIVYSKTNGKKLRFDLT